MSPHKIYEKDCTCCNPHRELITAQDHIGYMITRLKKLLKRITTSDTIVSELHDAFLRVLYELRNRDEELFHLVGWETIDWRKNRREYNIVLMIPELESLGCHKAISHILVRCTETGKYSGQIEDVAVRYREDWEDWTICQDFLYFRDELAPKRDTISVNPGEEFGERLWEEIRLVKEGIRGNKGDFLARLKKTLNRLEDEGQEVIQFSVENQFRRSSEKSKTLKPVIRIALYSNPSTRTSDIIALEELNLEENRNQPVPEKPSHENLQEKDENVVAVMLIDLSRDGPNPRVKLICTIYPGEFPITHHHRRMIPPPDLSDLEELVVTYV